MSPVYNVKAVPLEKIRANTYNPNSVAPPEMELLETSIWEDGYTMPVVCYYLPNEDIYEIVDGFHRYTTMMRSKRIKAREKGLLPVVVIDKDESNRMASTIRHNRARGSHSIELMSNIVSELTKSGMSDAWILKHVGMDKDELLRLKQITGLADLFKDKEFSKAFGSSGKNIDEDTKIEEPKDKNQLGFFKKEKGLIDMGLTVLLGWGIIAGAAFFGLVNSETQTRSICEREGTFQIGNSLYSCKREQTLGIKPRPWVIERVIEKPVPRKCPTCKPQKPCGPKEEKKNPMCIEVVK